MYLRLFAHILVGFLIGALYYDIGNDGAKVLSNLGFLFFNMLFLMYTSMTITILSCKFIFYNNLRLFIFSHRDFKKIVYCEKNYHAFLKKNLSTLISDCRFRPLPVLDALECRLIGSEFFIFFNEDFKKIVYSQNTRKL